MKLIFSILSVCLATIAFAAHDFGVEQEVDEFTGDTTCSQMVINAASDFTGLSLSYSSTDPVVYLFFIRATDGYYDSVFNMFSVMSGDRIYVRFPQTDDVLQLDVEHTAVESDYEVAALRDSTLATRIMSSPTDVRVRFNGSDGTADFTIDHDVVVQLAQGFGNTCLP